MKRFSIPSRKRLEAMAKALGIDPRGMETEEIRKAVNDALARSFTTA